MSPGHPPSEESDLATRMERLRVHLRQREFAAAHEAACELRTQQPGNRDVLYMLAVSLRGLGRVAEALDVLQELERHHPSFGRLYEERGHCHLAQRAMDPAITAFSKAVRLNPWLLSSSRALEGLYRMSGRAQDAEAAARFSAGIEQVPEEIRTANSFFAEGDIRAAEQLVRQYLLTHGDHIEGLRLVRVSR